MWGWRSGGELRFAPRSDIARAHMAQTTLTHDTAPSEGPTGGGANASLVADSSVACLLIHTPHPRGCIIAHLWRGCRVLRAAATTTCVVRKGEWWVGANGGGAGTRSPAETRASCAEVHWTHGEPAARGCHLDLDSMLLLAGQPHLHW